MLTKAEHSLSGIKEYFSRNASGYTQKTQSGVWDIVKKKEKEAIWKLLKPQAHDAILDAGCGDGYYLSQLESLGCDAQGIDFSPRMVEEAQRKGLNVIAANLEEPLNLDKKFDKILCPGVFEFCQDAGKILMNLKGALKPEGSIILLIPGNSWGGYAYRMYHRFLGCGEYIKLYSLEKIKELALACGLRVNEMIVATPLSFAVKLVNLPTEKSNL